MNCSEKSGLCFALFCFALLYIFFYFVFFLPNIDSSKRIWMAVQCQRAKMRIYFRVREIGVEVRTIKKTEQFKNTDLFAPNIM